MCKNTECEGTTKTSQSTGLMSSQCTSLMPRWDINRGKEATLLVQVILKVGIRKQEMGNTLWIFLAYKLSGRRH